MLARLFVVVLIATRASGASLASQLLQSRSPAALWRSFEEASAALERDSVDEKEKRELRLKAAESLLGWMRQHSEGNSLAHDGRARDTSSNRRLWKEFGPRAMRLLEDAKPEGQEEQAKHAFLKAEAFMYTSSSRGVARAAVRGDALTFRKNVGHLLRNYPRFGDGVGHTFMGAFYLAAPWPVGNAEKSEKHFAAAWETRPDSRRNNYYRGVVLLKRGNTEKAREFFEKAIKSGCTSTEEADIGEFFLKESERGLEAIEAAEKTRKQKSERSSSKRDL